MPTNINYMLKVTDVKMADIKKALEAAGIRVRGIVQLHKEEVPLAEGPSLSPAPGGAKPQ